LGSKAEELRQEDLGRIFGMSQSHMSKLLQIAKGLKPELFKQWRESALEVNVAAVWKISKLPAENQDAEWLAAFGRSEKTGGSTKEEKLEKTVAGKALVLADHLRVLVSGGLIAVDGFDAAIALTECFPSFVKLNAGQKKRVIGRFVAGLSATPKEDKE
jgi:hypothetical protein